MNTVKGKKKGLWQRVKTKTLYLRIQLKYFESNISIRFIKTERKIED